MSLTLLDLSLLNIIINLIILGQGAKSRWTLICNRWYNRTWCFWASWVWLLLEMSSALQRWHNKIRHRAPCVRMILSTILMCRIRWCNIFWTTLQYDNRLLMLCNRAIALDYLKGGAVPAPVHKISFSWMCDMSFNCIEALMRWVAADFTWLLLICLSLRLRIYRLEV